MDAKGALGGELLPAPANVEGTLALIRDGFPDLVDIDRSSQAADDGHDVVVLHAVSRAPGDDVRRAQHGFLRRWDAVVPAEQRRYLRVVFALGLRDRRQVRATDFLNVADVLRSIERPAARRSAVSRAYYAVFHAATRAQRRLGARRSSSHAVIGLRFQASPEKAVRAIGDAFLSLKAQPVESDDRLRSPSTV